MATLATLLALVLVGGTLAGLVKPSLVRLSSRWKVLGCALIGFFVVGWMASGEDSPSQDAPAVETTEKTKPKIVEKPEPKEEAISITAADLIEAYDNNEIRANKLYKGKRLEIRGFVGNVAQDIFRKPFLVLTTERDPLMTSFGVQCYVRDTDVLAELDKGMEVVLRGRGGGKFLNVRVDDAVIVKVYK